MGGGPHQGVVGQIGLHAAPFPAPAQRPAGNVVGMAEFSRHAVCTFEQAVVEVKAHADAVVEHDHREGVAVARRIDPVQRFCDHVGVVGQDAFRLKGLGQRGDDGNVAAGKGGAPDHHAGAFVDDTLGGHTDFPDALGADGGFSDKACDRLD